MNGYGRRIPEGGILDPATGTWAPLPETAQPNATWNLHAAACPWMLVSDYLYDDDREDWTHLGAPAGHDDYGPAASVVADHTAIALGGIDWSRADSKDLTMNFAWVWAP